MQDHLTRTFTALSDPTRRAMLARLSKGEANVSDLAKPFLKNMSLPAVTKHLKVLENAGFSDVYNVLHGFEGDLDENFHRGHKSGWRFDGLPWAQM